MPEPGSVQRHVPADVVWHESTVGNDERQGLRTGAGAIVWLTGFSGSGKSTIAVELERHLVDRGLAAYLLDGDNVRHGLNNDLGFSAADRDENVRRVGEVAILFGDAGLIVVVPLVSPYRAARDAIKHKARQQGLRFLEVHVATAIEVCEERDTKGLYAKARAGELKGLTGIDDPYEPPLAPDLVLDASAVRPSVSVGRILSLLGL